MRGAFISYICLGSNLSILLMAAFREYHSLSQGDDPSYVPSSRCFDPQPGFGYNASPSMAKDGAPGLWYSRLWQRPFPDHQTPVSRSAAASSCPTAVFLVCSEKWRQKQLGLLVTLFWSASAYLPSKGSHRGHPQLPPWQPMMLALVGIL